MAALVEVDRPKSINPVAKAVRNLFCFFMVGITFSIIVFLVGKNAGNSVPRPFNRKNDMTLMCCFFLKGRAIEMELE